MLKSKGDAFWKECFELIVTTLIQHFSLVVKTTYKLFFNVLVAILGQEKWMKNPCILPEIEQINQHTGTQ